MTRTARPPRTSVPVADAATRAATLRRLELAVLRRLDGAASGEIHTATLGPGSERADARAYAPGDDARLIDWSLTARMGGTYVRQTEADREYDTWLVVDRSASLDFGTAQREKRDVVLGAAAAFGVLAVRGSNRLGLLVAGTDRLVHRPPRAGRAAFMATLATVFDTPRQESAPPPASDLAAALRRLLVAQPRRSQVVVVSDFLGSDAWADQLRLASRRHQVIAVHVTDPRELELPAAGILAVVDTETGRQRYVQSSSPTLRARYAEAAAQRHAAIGQRVARSGAEYLHLSTDRDWLTDALLFATRRKGLRAPSAADRFTSSLWRRPVVSP